MKSDNDFVGVIQRAFNCSRGFRLRTSETSLKKVSQSTCVCAIGIRRIIVKPYSRQWALKRVAVSDNDTIHVNCSVTVIDSRVNLAVSFSSSHDYFNFTLFHWFALTAGLNRLFGSRVECDFTPDCWFSQRIRLRASSSVLTMCMTTRLTWFPHTAWLHTSIVSREEGGYARYLVLAAGLFTSFSSWPCL